MRLLDFFADLPSYFRPITSTGPFLDFVTRDANRPSFGDNSFDIIFGDPPYGINLKEGGFDDFIELVRIFYPLARESLIFLIPIPWAQKISRATGLDVQILSGHLSLGESRIPTCFLEIKKIKLSKSN